MPAPVEKGNTDWVVQAGGVSGIDGETVFYELPFRGSMSKAVDFRAAWKKGTYCTEPGFTNLQLIAGPTITEEEGGAGSAVLRFEAPDTSGDFGDPNPVETTWMAERRSITLPLPETIAAGTTYLYDAQIATVSFTKTTKNADPGAPPTLSDPYWVGIERAPVPEGDEALFPIGIADLVEDQDYEILATSTLIRVTERSPGVFEHLEWHERIMSVMPENPTPP